MIVHQFDSYSTLKICKELNALNSLTDDMPIGFYTFSKLFRDINLNSNLLISWGTLLGYIGNP